MCERARRDALTHSHLLFSYLSKVESLPNYGVHFYAVTDKRHTPWYLGISYKGIAQYDYADRRHPRRVNHELSIHQRAPPSLRSFNSPARRPFPFSTF